MQVSWNLSQPHILLGCIMPHDAYSYVFNPIGNIKIISYFLLDQVIRLLPSENTKYKIDLHLFVSLIKSIIV